MPRTWEIDDNGKISYRNGFKFSLEDTGLVIDFARNWHSGQFSSLYALQCGDYQPMTVYLALREMEACIKGEELTTEELQAIEDLTRWSKGIESAISSED